MHLKWKSCTSFLITLQIIFSTISGNVGRPGSYTILEGKIKGPESIAEYKGFFYSGVKNRLISFQANGNDLKYLPPLSCKANNRRSQLVSVRVRNGTLFVLDAYNGLYSIDLYTMRSELLMSTMHSNGTVKYNFLDDFDIDASNEFAYISIPNKDISLEKLNLSNLPRENNGGLIRFNLKTKQDEVIVSNLYFANGVQFTPDGQSLLITESTIQRISRYFISGHKKGSYEVFADKLRQSPDNIRSSPSGGYWVALVDFSIKSSYCLVQKLDSNGKIVDEVHFNRSGCTVSQATEVDGKLFLGSISNDYVGVVNL